MDNNKLKLISIEFRAGGQKYRAQEWQSRRGVTVTNMVTNEKAWDEWPVGGYSKYGSKLMVDLTISFFQSSANGMTKLRESNAHEPSESDI